MRRFLLAFGGVLAIATAAAAQGRPATAAVRGGNASDQKAKAASQRVNTQERAKVMFPTDQTMTIQGLVASLSPPLQYDSHNLGISLSRLSVPMVLCPGSDYGKFADGRMICKDGAAPFVRPITRGPNVENLGSIIKAEGWYRLYWYLPKGSGNQDDPERSEWSTPFFVKSR